jgi:hypothetical protein
MHRWGYASLATIWEELDLPPDARGGDTKLPCCFGPLSGVHSNFQKKYHAWPGACCNANHCVVFLQPGLLMRFCSTHLSAAWWGTFVVRCGDDMDVDAMGGRRRSVFSLDNTLRMPYTVGDCMGSAVFLFKGVFPRTKQPELL